MSEIPALRSVEAFPVESEGESYICLRDPMGLAGEPLILNKMLVFIVSRMDGSNSLRDIQADLMRATGELVPLESLQSLVDQLDEQHYLESPRFRSYYEGIVRDYLKAPARPAQHAGSAYESTAGKLRLQIDAYFSGPEGPGLDMTLNEGPPLRGLIAPHIDFHRGGPAYAHAYHALATHRGADRFILFGTCHTPMQDRFALTRKDFDTPLGLVETDTDFLDSLGSKLSNDYYRDEFSHRGEHSLEFQAVMLKYTFPQPGAFKIVPILVGSFHDLQASGRSAGEDGEIRRFVEALRATMSEFPSRCAVIAGADLAHVGRRFGDSDGPSEASMRQVESEDRHFLDLVAAGDADGMFRSIAADHDRRHVCGYPPIYMSLRALGNPQGKLLQYRQWIDYDSGAAVTYSALALF